MIRIVGLSATLPNYKDVASFLGVHDAGLFYFDASYRPVPLDMQFIGVKDKNAFAARNTQDDVCYDKVHSSGAPHGWHSSSTHPQTERCPRLQGVAAIDGLSCLLDLNLSPGVRGCQALEGVRFEDHQLDIPRST
jgi:hypothetical protein